MEQKGSQGVERKLTERELSIMAMPCLHRPELAVYAEALLARSALDAFFASTVLTS